MTTESDTHYGVENIPLMGYVITPHHGYGWLSTLLRILSHPETYRIYR
jgi:hypothetical protein